MATLTFGHMKKILGEYAVDKDLVGSPKNAR